jgi:hypothetical protein
MLHNLYLKDHKIPNNLLYSIYNHVQLLMYTSDNNIMDKE